MIVYNVIKESREKGERLIVEDLSKRCGFRVRHRFLKMSDDMFECEACGGFPRHWVKGLKPSAWIVLWLYQPPKETDFSPMVSRENLKSFAELKNLNEVTDKDIEIYPKKAEEQADNEQK